MCSQAVIENSMETTENDTIFPLFKHVWLSNTTTFKDWYLNKSSYPQMPSKTEHGATEAYVKTIDVLATVLTVLQQIVP